MKKNVTEYFSALRTLSKDEMTYLIKNRNKRILRLRTPQTKRVYFSKILHNEVLSFWCRLLLRNGQDYATRCLTSGMA